MQKTEMLEIARLAAREVLSQKKKIIDDEFEHCYHEVSMIMKTIVSWNLTTQTPRQKSRMQGLFILINMKKISP